MFFPNWTESFSKVAEKLGNRESRKIANNTYLVRRDDKTIALRLHATDVITFAWEWFELNTGGWFSVTTKDRQNYAAPIRVSSTRGVWQVAKIGDWDNSTPYFDGIRFDYDGNCLNPMPTSEADAIKADNAKTKKAIDKFVKLAMATLAEGMPLPSGGDCWYCAMVTSNGTALGDSMSDADHLREHMREGYVVPSLLVNAVTAKGYGYPAVILGCREDGMGGGHEVAHAVRRALRDYLKARLLTSETGVKPMAGSTAR